MIYMHFVQDTYEDMLILIKLAASDIHDLINQDLSANIILYYYANLIINLINII